MSRPVETAVRRIAAFDGLRGIAALMVFVDHRFPGADAYFLGGYAVHSFFVLSGFLIIGALHDDQRAIDDGQKSPLRAWRAFMGRRVARIFPLYYLILAIFIIFNANGIGPRRDTVDLFSSALFLTNEYLVMLGHWGSSLNQAWSLAVEEQFYLLAAPLLLLTRPRAASTICISTAVVGALWSMWLSYRFMGSMAPGLDSLANFTYIAIGGALALHHRPSSITISRWVQPVALMSILAIPFLPFGGHTFVLRLIAQPVLVAILLAELRDHQETPVARLLSTRLLVALGNISYGFYLLHQFISADLLRYMSAGLINITHWSPMAQFLPLLAASLCVAVISWRWFEQPIIRWTKSARLQTQNIRRAVLVTP